MADIPTGAKAEAKSRTDELITTIKGKIGAMEQRLESILRDQIPEAKEKESESTSLNRKLAEVLNSLGSLLERLDI